MKYTLDLKFAPGTPAHFSHLRNKFVTIVAFGDSITDVNHHTLGCHNWVGLLSMGLQGADVFPEGYTIINSGKGGDDMTKALARLDRDVLRFHPDIVIFAFGMNDCRTATTEKFRAQLIEAITRIRAGAGSGGECSIILRTPNPMVDLLTGRELHDIPEGNGKFCKTDLAAFAQVIREVAAAQNTLCVDHYTRWTNSMKSSCVGDIVQLMNDPIHPNAQGHRRFYHELAPYFHAQRNFFFEWERILRDEGALP
ncbi:MAG: SGNH/GDSL hydrolase family protein [Phycisphaerae bacterium]